ncbi:MAG TPA: hypothetical protein VFD51_03880, partial [Patescibacteria group bacterium]|nr:hypothetical protein [Patescibacteria group bacterium]
MMNLSRLKKPLLIIAFILSIVLIGYLLWKLFFQDSLPVQTPSGQVNTSTSGGLPLINSNGNQDDGEITGPGRLPDGNIPNEGETDVPIGSRDPQATQTQTIANGGLTETKAIVISKSLSPSLSSDGSVKYYNREDGFFYKIDKDGNAVKLSDKIFHQVKDVTWAPNTNKAIIEYPDGTKISYDFNTNKQVTLPSYWEEFSFSPDGEQITTKSIGLDSDNRWLVVSGADASKATALESIGDRADYVYPSWSPNNQIVAYYTKGVDFDRQEVFFVGLNGENFKSTIVEGRGVQTQWSTEGDNLLYSAYHSRDDYKPKLWIVGSSGDNIGADRRSLEINTWADKCTFASNTEIYCAVPETLETGAGMFPELADRTKDNLYKIDLNTGAKTLIAIPNGAYNISQILVPED